jgi:hypothetical protein
MTLSLSARHSRSNDEVAYAGRAEHEERSEIKDRSSRTSRDEFTPRSSRGDVTDPDSERREEQCGSEPDDEKWVPLGRAERGRGREFESGLGGVVDGLPGWLDGYWDREPDIPRIARGVKDRVNRLRALGNAVVPEQAYPIFQAIVEVEKAHA